MRVPSSQQKHRADATFSTVFGKEIATYVILSCPHCYPSFTFIYYIQIFEIFELQFGLTQPRYPSCTTSRDQYADTPYIFSHTIEIDSIKQRTDTSINSHHMIKRGTSPRTVRATYRRKYYYS